MTIRSSTLEVGLGMMALSAATFRPLDPSWFFTKRKQAPIPLIMQRMDRKRSLESNSSRDSFLVTGAQMPPKTIIQRKASEEEVKDG